MSPNLDTIASEMREHLKEIEEGARVFTDKIKKAVLNGGVEGEVISQSILALRHIEDARMRYGKVIQYLGDGVSKFDK